MAPMLIEQLDYILYGCGNMLVLRDEFDKSKQFFYREGKLKNITTFQGCLDKSQSNIFIAVGESSVTEDRPVTLTIIDRNENIWHSANTQNHKGIMKQVTLNVEKDLVAASVLHPGSSAPEIFIWNYKREKLSATMQYKLINFHQFIFHSKNHSDLFLLGKDYFRIWSFHYQEKIIKEGRSMLTSKQERNLEFIQMCYAPCNSNPLLVVLCKSNKVLLLQNDILKRVVDLEISSLNVVTMKIQKTKEKNNFIDLKVEYICLTSTRRGLVFAGTNGFISYYTIEYNPKHKDDMKGSSNKPNSIGVSGQVEKMINMTNTESYQIKDLEHGQNIINLSCSTNTSILSLIFQKKNKDFDYYVINFQLHLTSDNAMVTPFMSAGFHKQNILSLSVSRSKAVYATSGLDDTIRIWNCREIPGEEKDGLLFKKFKETPYCISLHPFGFFIAIAFSTGFKVYAIMNDSIFVVKETNLVQTKIVKYAKGGHYLFANEKSNILVYDGVYYENLFSFEDHMDSIIDFQPVLNDKFLISTDKSGEFFMWKFQEDNRLDRSRLDPSHVLSEDCYQSFDYDSENSLLVGSSLKMNLIVYGGPNLSKFIVSVPSIDASYNTIKVANPLKVLAAGTSKGTVRLHPWPCEELEPLNLPGIQKAKYHAFVEFTCFGAPVSVIDFTSNFKHLIICGKDGTHILQRFSHADEDVLGENNAGEERSKHSDVINDLYFNRNSKMKEQNDQIRRLQFEYKRTEQAMQIELQKLKSSYEDRLVAIDENFKQSMEETEKIKDDFIAKAESNVQTREKEWLFLKEKYESQCDAADNKDHFNINYEIERNQKLREEITELKKSHKIKIEEMAEKNKEIIQNVKLELQKKLEDIEFKYNSIVENAQVYGSSYLDMIGKEEAEHEKEITKIIWELEKSIEYENKQNEVLKEENLKLTSENEESKAKDMEKQKQFEDLVSENTNLLEQKVKICIGLLKMQEQLLEREQVIFTKDETLKMAKDEQINLENFRFMLDQKIKGLSAEKDELTQSITGKEKMLNEMFEELIKESSKNKVVSKDLTAKNTMIKILEEEKRKKELELYAWADKLKGYLNDINQGLLACKSFEEVFKMLKQTLDKGMVLDPSKMVAQAKNEKNIFSMLNQSQKVSQNIHEEVVIQNKWLAKKLNIINVASKNIQQIREENISVALNQNKNLIKQCNELREENDFYLKELRKLQKLVREASHKRDKLEKERAELQKIEARKRKGAKNAENISSGKNETGAEIGTSLMKAQGNPSQNFLKQSGEEGSAFNSREDSIGPGGSGVPSMKLPPIKGKQSQSPTGSTELSKNVSALNQLKQGHGENAMRKSNVDYTKPEEKIDEEEEINA